MEEEEGGGGGRRKRCRRGELIATYLAIPPRSRRRTQDATAGSIPRGLGNPVDSILGRQLIARWAMASGAADVGAWPERRWCGEWGNRDPALLAALALLDSPSWCSPPHRARAPRPSPHSHPVPPINPGPATVAPHPRRLLYPFSVVSRRCACCSCTWESWLDSARSDMMKAAGSGPILCRVKVAKASNSSSCCLGPFKRIHEQTDPSRHHVTLVGEEMKRGYGAKHSTESTHTVVIIPTTSAQGSPLLSALWSPSTARTPEDPPASTFQVLSGTDGGGGRERERGSGSGRV